MTQSVEFQIWRKYVCNMHKNKLQEFTLENEPANIQVDGTEFSLGITDERNIIERLFGKNKNTEYLTKNTMSFTADQIKEILRERYGIAENQPSETHDLIVSEDFTNSCREKELKVLINTSDYIICSVYKVSADGTETDVRDQDNEEELVANESGYFTSSYGSKGNEAYMTMDEWIQRRFLGVVPLFIKEKSSGVCTLVVLHLPNDKSDSNTFTQEFAELVDFSTKVKPAAEGMGSVDKIQKTIFDFKASASHLQEDEQLDENGSQNLTTEAKVEIIQKMEEEVIENNLNPALVKCSVANQLQISSEDINKSQEIKDYMRSIGGTNFSQQSMNMSKTFATLNNSGVLQRSSLGSGELQNNIMDQMSGNMSSNQLKRNASQVLESTSNSNQLLSSARKSDKSQLQSNEQLSSGNLDKSSQILMGTSNNLADSFQKSTGNFDIAMGTQNSISKFII